MASVVSAQPPATSLSVTPEPISEGSNSSGQATITGSFHEDSSYVPFPQYALASTSFGIPQIYSRALLSSGHGFAPSNITGDVHRPEEHFEQGACIGDVGYMNEYGAFIYCFNIFCDWNHPIQPHDTPRDFIPFHDVLSPEDVEFTPEYHRPGTIITSPGVKMTMISESPLIARFSPTIREGAVLVLPTGASREDLVAPSKLYSYINLHARKWYQQINDRHVSNNTSVDNPKAKTLTVPNGTLHLITGVDRANSWATATFPYRRTDNRISLNFQYNEGFDPPWKNVTGMTTIYRHHKESSLDENLGAVFLRSLSIAVNETGPMRSITVCGGSDGMVQEAPTIDIPRCVLPSTEMRDSGIRRFITGSRLPRALVSFAKPMTKKISPCPHELVFNPSVILLQIMLKMSPSASVAIIPDAIWRAALTDQYMSHPEFDKLVNQTVKISNEIQVEDGVATFVTRRSPETQVEVSTNALLRTLLKIIPCYFPSTSRRRRMLHESLIPM